VPCAEIDIYSRLRIQHIRDNFFRLMGYTSVLSNSNSDDLHTKRNIYIISKGRKTEEGLLLIYYGA